MKFIMFKQAGVAARVLFLNEASIPNIKNDEVLVKVMARPINPSDYMFIQGQYRAKPVFPQIAGLEGSGVIEKTGESVIDFKTGDHVAFRAVGTWAEYIVIKQDLLILVNNNIAFEQSCQLALNPVTAFGLLTLSGCNAESFLLLSAGASALAAIILQLAKEKGIKVICLVRHLSQQEELYRIGALAVLDQNDPDLSTSINKLTGNAGITSFLDAVGGRLLSIIIPLMQTGGKIIIYGRYDTNPAELYNADIIYRNLNILGFGIAQWEAEQTKERRELMFRSLIEKIVDKTLVLPHTQSFKLSDFVHAIEEDNSKKSGKILLIS